MTTRTVGSWYNAVGGQTLGGPGGYVTDALGAYGADYDIDRLTEAFEDALAENLPAGVYLAGDQIIAEVDYPGDPLQDVRDAVEAVDFYELAMQYDRVG